MITRRLRLLVLLTALAVAVSAVSALASGKTVKVGDNYYGPKSLTVGKGTKVTWNWVGVLKHNIVVHKGPSSFDSKTQVRGSYSHTFTKTGTYQLVCTVHPSMKMTVAVR